MDDLIARLEAATEGSRDLDYAIAEELGREQVRDMQGTFAPWKYTTSIDAALTLVPEGWRTIAGQNPTTGRWYWSIGCNAGVIDSSSHDAHSSNVWWGEYHEYSAPIAICIAALKARQAIAALKARQK